MSISPIILRSDDRVEGANVQATASDSGYPASNVRDWKDYTVWQASGANSYRLYFNLGSQQSADCMGIAGHNLDTQGVTQIKLEASTDDIVYTEIISNFTPPNGDDAIIKTFTQVSRRYWKVTFANGGGANFTPQVGIWYIGNKIELPRGPRTPFDPDHIEDKTSKFIGGEGNLIGVTRDYTIRKMRYSHNLITQAFITDTWLPFLESYRTGPFLFAWDPDGHSAESYLMWFDSDSHGAPYEGKWRRLEFDLVGRKV